MKTARIEANGQAQDVTVAANGKLLLPNGKAFEGQEWNWLPPPHAVIYGLALNFADHARELNFAELPEEPIPFIKNPSSVVGHLAPVARPAGVRYMHYEGELGVVIGKAARNVKRDKAMEHVRGYTICNDFTVRDFVGNFYRPPIKAKGFDTFGPVGPWIVDAADIPDPHQLSIQTRVNGELRQDGNTRDLIFDIPALIEWFSQFMTLAPGAIISTGTPRGLSDVQPGDTVEVRIDGIGSLVNTVVSA